MTHTMSKPLLGRPSSSILEYWEVRHLPSACKSHNQ